MMMSADSDPQPRKLSTRAQTREMKRADALRENLRKRKAQAQQQPRTLPQTDKD